METLIIIVTRFVLVIITAGLTFGWGSQHSWGWLAGLALIISIINHSLCDQWLILRRSRILSAAVGGLAATVTAFVLTLIRPELATDLVQLASFGLIVLILEYLFYRLVPITRIGRH